VNFCISIFKGIKVYKKFIIKIIVIEIILLIAYSIVVLNFKMFYMDPEYPMWLEVKQRTLNKTNNDIDIIMLGDSRAKAGFKPNILKEYNISSINLSVGGATPVEGYYTLKRYLKNNKAPKNLVLSYTPTHLSTSDGCYFDRTVLFDFFTDSEYKEVENLAIKFNDYYILNQHKSYLDYKYPTIYGKHFIEGIKNFRWLKNNKFLEDSKKDKGYHCFGTNDEAIGLNSEAEENKFILSKLYDYYLKKILDLAIKHKIRVYFYIMPFNESSYNVVKKEYVREYENYLKKLTSYKNIKMDVCNNIWYLSNDNFGDPSHLYKGTDFNTLKVLNCIKQ